MCANSVKQEAQNPIIIPSHRLMEAFAKSDDEREFFIDRHEGFIIYVDLDKSQEELNSLYGEMKIQPERYCAIPKLSYYETKKIMEGFVNEKVYDIDTKEKLLDIIQSKEARENFIEFIFDHHAEQEKWQQFYQERSRVRIIEWLRMNHFHFVFEEDLELPRSMIEKLKQSLFLTRVSKEILNARKVLVARAKIYYSNEALNPRPKRGRPPKQAIKQEIEHQVTVDVYTSVPLPVRPFLFTPEHSASFSFSMFSQKFEKDDDFIQHKLGLENIEQTSITQKLASIRSFSSKWGMKEEGVLEEEKNPYSFDPNFDDDEEDDEDDDFEPKIRNSKQKLSSEPNSKSKNELNSLSAKAPTKPIAEKNLKKLSPPKTKAKKETPQASSTKMTSVKKAVPVKKAKPASSLPEKASPTKPKRIIPQPAKGNSTKIPLKKIIPTKKR